MTQEEQLAQAQKWLQNGQPQQALQLYQHILKQVPESAEAHYGLGVIFQQAGEHHNAESHLRLAVQYSPKNAVLWQSLGNFLRLQGHFSEALTCLEQAWQISPNPRLAFQLGLLAQQQQQWPCAMGWYQQALERQPHYAQAWNNLANVHLAQGQLSRAADCLQQAVALQPSYLEAWFNLAQVWRQLEQLQAARQCYQQVLLINPDLPEVHDQLAHIWLALGQPHEAQNSFQNALALNPNLVQAANNLGNLYKLQGQVALARTQYSHCMQIQPDFMPAYLNLAALEQEQADTPSALHWLSLARQHHASDALRLLQATLLSPIMPGLAAMDHAYAELQTALNQLEADSPLNIVDPLLELPMPLGFYLAYHHHSNQNLLVQISRIASHFLPQDYPRPNPTRGHKIRVGFVSRFFCNHSVAHYFAPLLLSLPPETFEVILYAAPNGRQDELTERLKAHTAAWIPLPFDLAQSRQLIAASAPEILIYTDIGTEPFTWLLAHTRLAPVQAAMLGHPITTGIATIDYYLSSAELETPESQAHYSEQLIPLPGLPASYPFPELPNTTKSRSELGLSNAHHLYLCPATLFKIHPDFDRAVADILNQDEQAQVVMFQDRLVPYHPGLQQRFKTTLNGQHKRVEFLPWASRDDYFSYLQVADVVLDTFYFGGGNTAFLTMAVGAPTVTWPSSWARGRTYAALYQRLNLPELITADPYTYAAQAVAIATQPALKRELQNRIHQGKSSLYQEPTAIQAFQDWLQQIR